MARCANCRRQKRPTLTLTLSLRGRGDLPPRPVGEGEGEGKFLSSRRRSNLLPAPTQSGLEKELPPSSPEFP